MKSFCQSLLCVAALLLSGCIDGEEEITIGADGSARVKAVYRVPAVLMSTEDAEDLRASIQREVGGADNLVLLINKVEKHNGKRVIIFEIETDNAMDLEGCLTRHAPDYQPSKGDRILHAIVGQIRVDLGGLKASLVREIDLGPLLADYLGSNSPSMLGESEFRYTVHLPHAVETSNAHQVVNDGRTLKWSHKLIDCRNTPIKLTMTSVIPIPWWVYAVAMFFLVVAGRFIYVRMMSSHGKSGRDARQTGA